MANSTAIRDLPLEEYLRPKLPISEIRSHAGLLGVPNSSPPCLKKVGG
jgi:hypothetical protein